MVHLLFVVLFCCCCSGYSFSLANMDIIQVESDPRERPLDTNVKLHAKNISSITRVKRVRAPFARTYSYDMTPVYHPCLQQTKPLLWDTNFGNFIKIRLTTICIPFGGNINDIANSLTHLKAIYTAITQSSPNMYALILEDDMSLQFAVDFPHFIASLPKDFSIIQLSHKYTREFPPKLMQKRKKKHQAWTENLYSTGAYIINKRIMRELLAPLLSQPPGNVIDIDFIIGRDVDWEKRYGFVYGMHWWPCYPKQCCQSDNKYIQSGSTFPCILARYSFADSYIYNFGNALTSTIPLFVHASKTAPVRGIVGVDVKTNYRNSVYAELDLVKRFYDGQKDLPSYIKPLHSRQHISMPQFQPSKHVVLLHNVYPCQSRGGDTHVWTQVRAWLELNYQVTMVIEAIYKVAGAPFDLTGHGVNMLTITEFTDDLNHRIFPYDVLAQFLWPGPNWQGYLQKINAFVRQRFSWVGIILINPDIMYRRLEREYALEGKPCLECANLTKIEVGIWNSTDVVVGVNNELSVEIAKVIPHKKVLCLPYHQEHLNSTEYSWKERSGVIYYGTAISANLISAQWLVDNVGDALFKSTGDFLNIYGEVSPVGCNVTNGCIAHGPVSVYDLHEAIGKSRWMVAPIFTSVGVSTKITKALALGTPVLTTMDGTGGMEGEPLDSLPMRVVDIKDFVTATVDVYKDEALWTRFHSECNEFVDRVFGMGRLARITEEVMQMVEQEVAGRNKVSG